MQSRDAAIAQIRLDERAGDRLRHGEQPPCRFRRSGRGRVRDRVGASGSARARQAEERARLIGDILEVDQAAAFADHVEQIAMLGRGGIGPVPGGALTGFRLR